MIAYLDNCFLYILPVLLSGVLFIFTVKRGFFGFLDVPVSKGLFGTNKTLRGFVLMPAYCLLFAWLLSMLLGARNEIYVAENIYKAFFLGLAYPLGELPNSFIKRRLGIVSGGVSSRSWQRIFFFVLDNVDSVILCCVYFFWAYRVSLYYLPGVFALGALAHFLTDLLMIGLKLKRRK
jgi:hypothetical protein